MIACFYYIFVVKNLYSWSIQFSHATCSFKVAIIFHFSSQKQVWYNPNKAEKWKTEQSLNVNWL